MSDLLLLGASGLAREARPRGGPTRDVVGFLDDDPSKWAARFDGVVVSGGIDDVPEYPESQLLLCAGKGPARAAIGGTAGFHRERRGHRRHPSQRVVPPTCSVGVRCMVSAGSVLTTNVEIGGRVVASRRDNLIESFVTLCAGVAARRERLDR